MEIRPKERDALIFSATARSHGEDCLILDMNDGRLELRYVLKYLGGIEPFTACEGGGRGGEGGGHGDALHSQPWQWSVCKGVPISSSNAITKTS
jgi:hypothetical protein